MKTNKSYGLFMIKPDGMRQDVINKCKSEFSKYELKIIMQADVLLSQEILSKVFYHQFEDYTNYMTSSESRVFLIESQCKGIDKLLLQLKHSIRIHFGINHGAMKNLVHSAQQGTEFSTQLKALFPKVDVKKFQGTIDDAVLIDMPIKRFLKSVMVSNDQSRVCEITFLCPVHKKDEWLNGRIDLEHNLKIRFGLIERVQTPNYDYDKIWLINTSAEKQLSDPKSGQLSGGIYIGRVSIPGMDNNFGVRLQRATIHECNEIELKYYDVLKDIIENEKEDVRGIYTESSSFTIWESEARNELSRSYGLSAKAGSFDSVVDSEFGCDEL